MRRAIVHPESEIHRGLKVLVVEDELKRFMAKHQKRLKTHVNVDMLSLSTRQQWTRLAAKAAKTLN